MASDKHCGRWLAIVALLTFANAFIVGCGDGTEPEMNTWGYPRVISRDVAIQLLRETQVSARGLQSTSCSISRDFSHDIDLVPVFLQLNENDIVDFGKLRSAVSHDEIEILLSGPEWPDRGIWLVVRIHDNHCLSWTLAPAIEIERQSLGS